MPLVFIRKQQQRSMMQTNYIMITYVISLLQTLLCFTYFGLDITITYAFFKCRLTSFVQCNKSGVKLLQPQIMEQETMHLDHTMSHLLLEAPMLHLMFIFMMIMNLNTIRRFIYMLIVQVVYLHVLMLTLPCQLL